MRSPSARKVWIEICKWKASNGVNNRHLPQGRCGLKWDKTGKTVDLTGHLPQGRCGLKLHYGSTEKAVDDVTFRKEGVD